MAKKFARLSPDDILRGLDTSRIGSDVVVFNSVSSTNDIAWKYADSPASDGTVIFAERQTIGRGRRANKWISPDAMSILCSALLIEPKIEAELLTLVSAVAVAEAIGRCGSEDAKIKWPNDILLGDKKAAGILVEARDNNFVIGIGINCHQKQIDFDEQIDQPATSIDIETGAVSDRVSIARRLLVSLDQWLAVAESDSEKVIDCWRRLSSLLGRRITLEYNNRKFSGHCTDIDPRKGLVLHLDNGGVRMFDAAYTSVAK